MEKSMQRSERLFAPRFRSSAVPCGSGSPWQSSFTESGTRGRSGSSFSLMPFVVWLASCAPPDAGAPKTPLRPIHALALSPAVAETAARRASPRALAVGNVESARRSPATAETRDASAPRVSSVGSRAIVCPVRSLEGDSEVKRSDEAGDDDRRDRFSNETGVALSSDRGRRVDVGAAAIVDVPTVSEGVGNVGVASERGAPTRTTASSASLFEVSKASAERDRDRISPGIAAARAAVAFPVELAKRAARRSSDGLDGSFSAPASISLAADVGVADGVRQSASVGRCGVRRGSVVCGGAVDGEGEAIGEADSMPGATDG